jgi:hypothetical protein
MIQVSIDLKTYKILTQFIEHLLYDNTDYSLNRFDSVMSNGLDEEYGLESPYKLRGVYNNTLFDIMSLVKKFP